MSTGLFGKKEGLLLFLSLFIALIACKNTEKITDYTAYVDPFIGTGGHGHTYPGASVPFGMVQLSPDTRLTGWDGCSGYHYSDSIIYGFSHTHLSGTGCSDYGDILLMPTTGTILAREQRTNAEHWVQSTFSHKNEKATPGYYSVILNNDNISAELTVTARTGFHKYTFPDDRAPVILIDLLHRDLVIEASLKKVNDFEVVGLRRSKAWAKDQYVYFVARFSKPLESFEIFEGDSLTGTTEVSGKALRCIAHFRTEAKNNIVMVKVGISAVSSEGARKNLENEIPDWNFEAVREKAKDLWNASLERIEVEGGSEAQKRIFYTALYHSLLSPNLFMDVDGSYRGTDLQIHQAVGFTNYTVFSLWDTYRATHPLFTIIEQDRTIDFINTFLKQYEYGGKLPMWELAANYTGCMIGYHAVPVIVDAYLKGLTNFDKDEALKAMVHSAESDHLGLDAFKEYNYIPGDREHESVSKTLEYAYDDWCIAMMAKDMGNEEIFKRYIKRSQAYKNIFNPETAFMQAKMNQQWVVPFDPREVNFHFTEANSWQYSFYVPQDISGLMQLMGGKEAFVNKLDELFSTSSETSGREQADITGLIGQYAHGNEPSHHMAYLYSYAGIPWKSQERAQQIIREMYTDQADGLCGNEDCGQMSSWFVFSAMGFYPVCPGSGTYVIGSPIFEKVTIHLKNGKQFIITSEGVSEKDIYIRKAKLNGKAYSKSYLLHSDIVNGGKLRFQMGSEPSKSWGSDETDLPVSVIDGFDILLLPYVIEGAQTFTDSTLIRLGHPDKDVHIYYTLDGTNPDMQSAVYQEPLVIDHTVVLKAFAYKEGYQPTNIIRSDFSRIVGGRKILLKSKYSSQYTGGGDQALIDLSRGSDNFRLDAWQGYQYDDFQAIVDLGNVQKIKRIAASFLQDMGSWIWFPVNVEYAVSTDNQNYKVVGRFRNDFSLDETGTFTEEFPLQLNTNTRYVRVKAKNLKYCPEWHPGAGGKAWIFIDEIIVE